eukprot:9362395-Alexandrium_andersonii.AAC.1
MKTGSPHGGAGPLLVRKPIRWASSSTEVLRRVCRKCANATEADVPHGHQHGVLQGRLSSG